MFSKGQRPTEGGRTAAEAGPRGGDIEDLTLYKIMSKFTGEYITESLLIPAPPTFDFLPRDAMLRNLESMIFFPQKALKQCS